MSRTIQILVLDDDRDAADSLSALLASELEGAVLRVAYSGNDAVAFAAERRPDVAICDLEMCGMDGEGVAQALRSAFPEASLLLIAVSGNMLRLGALRETGTFDHLLSKPLDAQALVRLLKGRPQDLVRLPAA